jgi:hypothetical protein
MMKYFTREWMEGQYSDEAFEKVIPSYWRYVEQLMHRLPPSVAELAKEVNLHDGLFRKVIVNRQESSLALYLRCGDLQVGYFDQDLFYSGVDLTALALPVLAARARDRKTMIEYDEVDMDDQGQFVHRIIFSPKDEISITFAGLQLARTPQPNRYFRTKNSKYRVVE